MCVPDQRAASVGVGKQALASYQVLVVLSVLEMVGKYLGAFAIGRAGKNGSSFGSLADGSSSAVRYVGSSLSKGPVPCVDQVGPVIRSLGYGLVEITICSLEFGSKVTESKRAVIAVETVAV